MHRCILHTEKEDNWMFCLLATQNRTFTQTKAMYNYNHHGTYNRYIHHRSSEKTICGDLLLITSDWTDLLDVDLITSYRTNLLDVDFITSD